MEDDSQRGNRPADRVAGALRTCLPTGGLPGAEPGGVAAGGGEPVA